MKAIPISPFDAEVQSTTKNGVENWHRCEVVGVTIDSISYGKFIFLEEDDDGKLWTHAVDAVRRSNLQRRT